MCHLLRSCFKQIFYVRLFFYDRGHDKAYPVGVCLRLIYWRKKPEHFFNDSRTLKDAEIQELMNSDSEDLDFDYEVSDGDYEVTTMRRGHVA